MDISIKAKTFSSFEDAQDFARNCHDFIVLKMADEGEGSFLTKLEHITAGIAYVVIPLNE